MALTRQWTYPSEGTSVTVSTNTVTVTPSAGQPGFNLGADSLNVPNIQTAPANSSTAASITFGAPIQNTLGYDAQLFAYVQVTSASVATFAQGVASASVGIPTTNLITNTTGTNYFSFTAYVPAGYWYEMTAVQGNGLSVAASVNAQWQPV